MRDPLQQSGVSGRAPMPPAHRGLERAPALLIPLLACGLLMAGPLKAAETAVIQEILDGKEIYIDSRQARLKETARAPQQVRTGNTRGQIGFDTGAVGRLNRFSQLKLGRGCFLIDRGQILVSGKQGGCTRSARLSVRGTNYLLEVRPSGEADIAVLEGSVEVQPLRDGEPTGKPATTVAAGQRLRLSPEGVVLALLALSSADYNGILSGPLFQGFRLPLPAYGALESQIRSLPGVTLPSIPAPAPGLPIRLPRFF